MKLTSFFINLLEDFNPADEDFGRLKEDAKNWETSVPTDEKGLKDHPVQARIIKYTNEWYARVIIGFAYIFAKRGILDYLNPKYTRKEADEEDVEKQFEEFMKFKQRYSV